jgi:hypothetical protein
MVGRAVSGFGAAFILLWARIVLCALIVFRAFAAASRMGLITG